MSRNGSFRSKSAKIFQNRNRGGKFPSDKILAKLNTIMAFPQTRHTLIQRLAAGGDEEDWHDFMADYWGPVSRFALRRGNRELAEAEDVAATTFEVILRNDLLRSWTNSKRAKLRTLLCNVVCRVQANRFRADTRKQLFQREFAEHVLHTAGGEQAAEQDAKFLGSWVEDILQGVMQQLAKDYHAEGKGDYFRVLYGRMCEKMSISEVAESLEISSSAVDNYYRHVKKKLGDSLKSVVRSQVYRYCPPEQAENEFQAEWGMLAEYLAEHGGLEEAARAAYEVVGASELHANKPLRIQETLTKIRLSPHNK